MSLGRELQTCSLLAVAPVTVAVEAVSETLGLQAPFVAQPVLERVLTLFLLTLSPRIVRHGSCWEGKVRKNEQVM